tara:strand:- start:544 stop:756 length:213 start_codon:yes stop_codon:yes gene_type:complete
MNRGLLFLVSVNDSGFLISIFRLFHFGIVAGEVGNSNGTSLTLGFWRFFSSVTLEYRTPLKVDDKNAGVS